MSRLVQRAREAFAFGRYLHTSDGGRRHGWLVELHGQPLGSLLDARWEEQFWDSYEVHAFPGHDATLFHPPNWHHSRFTFRSIGYDRIAPHAFASARLPRISGDRVTMRGLYLTPRSNLERLTCWALAPG
jgi:hypothetical protein